MVAPNTGPADAAHETVPARRTDAAVPLPGVSSASWSRTPATRALGAAASHRPLVKLAPVTVALLILLVLGLLSVKTLGTSGRAEGQGITSADQTAIPGHTTQSMAVVPDLPGKSLDDARNAGVGSGLTVQESQPSYSTTYAAGSVASQEPEAGQQVSPGSPSTVTLSLGPEPVVVNQDDEDNQNAQPAPVAPKLPSTSPPDKMPEHKDNGKGPKK